MTQLGPLLESLHVLHSPSLHGTREASVRLLDARIAPLTVSGFAERVTGHEPGDIMGSVSTLVDLDASHVEDAVFRGAVKSIQVRQLSNAMKHLAALKAISVTPSSVASSTGVRFSAIVEDDALFTDNVATVLRSVVTNAPADADIVFMGLPSPRAPPQDGGAFFDEALKVFDPVVPAIDSYLVTPAAAAKMAAAFTPVRFPTHIQLSYLVKTLGLKAYVSVPNVFVDGSKIGVFASSLDPNNRLLWNQQYCQLEAVLRSGAVPTEAEFAEIWAKQAFKVSPDNVALRAAYLFKAGRFDEAEKAFEEAMETYDRNGCIVNNTSEFLRAFIALYRKKQ